MSKKRGFAQLFAPENRDVEYWTERAIIEIAEEIGRRMSELEISRAELARRLSCSPAYVTKVLRGNSNFTLESMVKMARALESECLVHLQPAGTESRWFNMTCRSAAVADTGRRAVTHRGRGTAADDEYQVAAWDQGQAQCASLAADPGPFACQAKEEDDNASVALTA